MSHYYFFRYYATPHTIYADIIAELFSHSLYAIYAITPSHYWLSSLIIATP